MLSLSNVTKSFIGAPAPVLKGISLELVEGELCMLLGANGSGKSTLMGIIAGDVSFDSGEVVVAGESSLSRRQWIASVVQNIDDVVVKQMTLLENLVLSVTRGKPARLSFYNSRRMLIVEKLRSLGLGLEDYVDRPVSSLSGGQRQMVALAMALMAEPKLILFDEHTSALDPIMRDYVMQYTVDVVKSNGLTGMVITHELSHAIKYGDRLLMLIDGKIALDVSNPHKANLKVADLVSIFCSLN